MTIFDVIRTPLGLWVALERPRPTPWLPPSVYEELVAGPWSTVANETAELVRTANADEMADSYPLDIRQISGALDRSVASEVTAFWPAETGEDVPVERASRFDRTLGEIRALPEAPA